LGSSIAAVSGNVTHADHADMVHHPVLLSEVVSSLVELEGSVR